MCNYRFRLFSNVRQLGLPFLPLLRVCRCLVQRFLAEGVALFERLVVLQGCYEPGGHAHAGLLHPEWQRVEQLVEEVALLGRLVVQLEVHEPQLLERLQVGELVRLYEGWANEHERLNLRYVMQKLQLPNEPVVVERLQALHIAQKA